MMLDLHDREWKDFRLLDYFCNKKGNQKNMAELQPGSIPLVSARNVNNGYKAFVSENEKDNLYNGRCLTINNDGDGGAGISYYQPFKMLLDSHVTALYPKENMSEEVLKFFSACITAQREKFGHGYPVTEGRLSVFRVMLPANEIGLPDYAFMEQYIKEREQQLIEKYTDRAGKNIQIGGDILPLAKKEWRPFAIDSLFILVSGKSKGVNHLQRTETGVPYLGATNRNNGVIDFVAPVSGMVQKGNCIAFIRNGEGSMGYSVYKKESFIATSDITVGYADFLNQYTGFFITTVADQVRGKYNFNYKRSDSRLKKELLQLPINENGMPDWIYMEEYTKQLFRLTQLRYLKYKLT